MIDASFYPYADAVCCAMLWLRLDLIREVPVLCACVMIPRRREWSRFGKVGLCCWSVVNYPFLFVCPSAPTSVAIRRSSLLPFRRFPLS